MKWVLVYLEGLCIVGLIVYAIFCPFWWGKIAAVLLLPLPIALMVDMIRTTE